MSKRFGRAFGRNFWGRVLDVLIKLLLRLEVHGADNLPAEGAGIAYYNHIHWLDPPLICGSMRRYAVPLTKIEVGRWPFVGWMLKCYGVTYITRGAVDRRALQATWDVLKQGHISVISPEGTRSLDGKLLDAKEGLMFIARRVPEAWLMPCAVSGTSNFDWHLSRLFSRPRAVITYGRPFRVRWPAGEDGQLVDRPVLAEMTHEAMLQLAALLPEELRGSYAQRGAESPRWLEFGV